MLENKGFVFFHFGNKVVKILFKKINLIKKKIKHFNFTSRGRKTFFVVQLWPQMLYPIHWKHQLLWLLLFTIISNYYVFVCDWSKQQSWTCRNIKLSANLISQKGINNNEWKLQTNGEKCPISKRVKSVVSFHSCWKWFSWNKCFLTLELYRYIWKCPPKLSS